MFENFGIFRVAPSKYISELNNYYFTDFYIDNIEELKYIIDDSVYQDNSPGIGSNVNNLYSSKSVLMHSWHCIQIDNSNINNSQIVKLTLSNVKFSNLKIYTVEKNGDELLIVNEITSNENNITLETSYSNLINNDLFIIIMNCSETNVSDAYTFSLTVESINVNESISTSNTQPIAFETNKQTYFRNVYVGDSGYYRFELDVDNADILNLREHSIEIYDNNMNLVKKFNHTNAEHAFSKDNQNSIVVYLNKTYNILEDVSTPYYLRIGVFNENIDGFIKIQNITDEEKVIDEDNYNEDGNFSNLVQIENVNGDNFSYYNFPIDGTLRILFDVPEYTSGVINFVVVASNSLYSSNISYYLYTWDNENDVIEAFVDTEVYKNICILIFSDTYQSKINISYTLECQNDFSIILDSSSTSLDLCGSEVRLNNGLRENNNITVGFTRNAFLSEDAPTNSRLEYYWISSNEKVASISQYGTILAVDEGKTIIQAKYNNDKYAIILVNVNPDTNTNPATFEITTDLRQDSTVGTYVSSGLGVSGENDLKIGYTRLLSLTNNAPSTIIQHYTWSTSDPTIATVSMYGTVQAKGVGIVTITAVYKYNSRYTSTIQIEIY